MERTRRVSRPAQLLIGSPLRGYGLEARFSTRATMAGRDASQ